MKTDYPYMVIPTIFPKLDHRSGRSDLQRGSGGYDDIQAFTGGNYSDERLSP
jgi:hypothetical protein